ncbi:MAG TPA: RuBisCO large subunit C-terminal-like domain-containing protein [Candidatus Nanopelagicaceae bacterium]|nr:RuBisCO large subunit C-terminal-like domain-containing protein [Candidatus Nanopelagicaceae bacterium]
MAPEEEYYESCKQYLDVPEAIGLDGIDLEKYIIASYIIKRPRGMNVNYLSRFAAIEQSTGTWVRVPAETAEVRKEHVARVLGVYELPHYEYVLPSKTDHPDRLYFVQIGFPISNIKGDGIPMLLTSVIGNISITHGLKLVDVAFPKAYLEDFKGPKFGIDGLRKLLKVPERPLLNNMVKPCTGHTCDVAADLVYQAAVGGCDVVKDDELIGNPAFNTLEDRITSVMEAVDRADSEKGEKTLYTINITSKFPEMFENADKMIELGANALMINYLTAGFEALRAVAEDPSIKVPILGHMDFAGAYFGGEWTGLTSMITLGKFPRMCGADTVVIPAPYGKAEILDERYEQNLKVLRYPFQHIKPTLPMPSGGITQGMVEKTMKEAGKDILIGSGGGIHSHPDGPTAGAKAFRQAIDAVMNGIEVKKYAKDHKELGKALGVWGTGKTALIE